MQFWINIAQLLKENHEVMLLYVFINEGSSPGKQGFKMAIVDNGDMIGSIGGGIMEQKLVELAKKHLESTNQFSPYLKKQIHSKDVSENQSGMICSGQQTIGFYKLKQKDIATVSEIISNKEGSILFSENGIAFKLFSPNKSTPKFVFTSNYKWLYKETIKIKHVAHIIGAGHVGLALSQTLFQLGFYIKIYDDRSNLYTMNQNKYAHEKFIVDFFELDKIILSNEQEYVILVSFGYRTDKIALKQLIHHQFKYIGMMGSKSKIKELFNELQKEGISNTALDKIYAPIGITKHNQSPEEIAVSIAAQMVQIKNN